MNRDENASDQDESLSLAGPLTMQADRSGSMGDPSAIGKSQCRPEGPCLCVRYVALYARYVAGVSDSASEPALPCAATAAVAAEIAAGSPRYSDPRASRLASSV